MFFSKPRINQEKLKGPAVKQALFFIILYLLLVARAKLALRLTDQSRFVSLLGPLSAGSKSYQSYF